MSEQFDAALRDLYDRTAARPDAGLDASLAGVTARARRGRRVRAAGATLAAAAVVVGGALAGTAAVRTLDAGPVPPATEPATPDGPVTGRWLDLSCGMPITDLLTFTDPPGEVTFRPVETSVPLGTPLVGDFEYAIDPDRVPPQGWNGAFELAAVHDGVIVGWGGLGGVEYQATVSLVPCDLALSTLPVGDYDLYGAARLTADGEDAYLLAGPWPFAVVPDVPPPSPDGDRVGSDGVSDAPPEDRRAPLPDGAYLALVTGVDAPLRELEADLLVWYSGQAAEDHVAATEPGGEATDGYAVGDPDGAETRRLVIRADAPVWEWCSGSSGIEVVQRAGGLREWAAAPSEVGERTCADGAAIPRWGYYWLDVRDGVVVQVVGQYVP